jgi:tetratricopeptide (TPR) repeat protein
LAVAFQIRSDEFRPLGALDAIQRGAGPYYRRLRDSADPILGVAAWSALLDHRLIGPADWQLLLAQCRYGAVRQRAFTLFQSVLEHDLARTAATSAAASLTELQTRAMLAELANDQAGVAEALGALYCETAEIGWLKRAAVAAEKAGGWTAALPWAVRMVAAAPLDPAGILQLYRVLEASGEGELSQEAAELLGARNLHMPVRQVFLASAALARGDAARAVTTLQLLDDVRIKATPALAPYTGFIHGLRAAAEEARGQYDKAYQAYVALNEAARDRSIDPRAFYSGIQARARLEIPPLPADGNPSIVQMVGFPRSGTTLLENALAAHPAIETFEEVPALDATFVTLEQELARSKNLSPEALTKARERYFRELRSRAHLPNAAVLVDKMPIRSADAAFISRLFPEWRYIFSIRHPFDVVLSCFKQRFVPNITMENFRSIQGAIRMYDYTMTEWFKQHSMDDAKVAYVRYEDLVEGFDDVLSSTLAFLGLQWSDSVRDFAAAAAGRSAKTPSYQKVRKGLTLGVQSSWRNYGFLFQSPEAKPLHRWAEFFGYPTR